MDHTLLSQGTPEFEKAYKHILNDIMKVVIFLAIIGLVGVIGNSLTIVYYRKQSPTSINIFILCLAATDLCVAIIALAVGIESVFNIKINSRFACKTLFFLEYWSVGLSIIIVSIIAVDRYRRMCMPMKRQVDASRAKKIVIVTTALIMIIALRAYLTTDLVPKQIVFDSQQNAVDNGTSTSHSKEQSISSNGTEKSNFTKNYKMSTSRWLNNTTESLDNTSGLIAAAVQLCSFSEESHLKLYVVLFHVVDIVLVISVILVNVFCYANVIKTIMIHRKSTVWLQKNHNIPKTAKIKLGVSIDIVEKCSNTDNFSDIVNADCNVIHAAGENSHESVKDETGQIESRPVLNTVFAGASTSSTEKANEEVSYEKKIPEKHTKRSNKSERQTNRQMHVRSAEIQITIAMCVVSVALLICFVPYFVYSIYILLLSKEDYSLNSYAILMFRTPFINCIVNVFIYCVFSTPFREFMFNLLCSCCSIP